MPPLELWRDIPGFEGTHQVSSLGRVKSLQRRFVNTQGQIVTRSEQLLKTFLHNEVPYVDVNWNGVTKRKHVARLVAALFLPAPAPGKGRLLLNHKDGNTLNNAASNLEWAYFNVALYNRLDDVRCIPIVQCDLDGQDVKEWSSASAAARELNLDRGNINHACRGKLKTCGGFRWRYRDERHETATSARIIAKKVDEEESLT